MVNVEFDFESDSGVVQRIAAEVSEDMLAQLRAAADGSLHPDAVLSGFTSTPFGKLSSGSYVYRAGQISNVRHL